MSHLQPWMLWALPAVLLPLIIHLLNLLRYKTVPWAATIFLLKANRSATRRAKLRQILLLACRMLVVFFLIWAMARPLVGGWLGAAAGGAPEVVMLLLDRSASMEARGGGAGGSKRAHALALLAEAARQSAGSRFILLENVLREPLAIADAATLAALQLAGPTQTAADFPAMLRAALDYLVKNKPGSAELWIASDLQASNWRPDSPEWADLAARIAGLGARVRVRVLDLSAPSAGNVSVAMQSAGLRVRDAASGKAQLSLMVELQAAAGRTGALPLFLTRDGAKSQVDLTLTGAVQRQNLKFDLPKVTTGWGRVDLPADDSLADNTAWFVHAPPVPLRAAIVGEGEAARRLRFAAAPDATRTATAESGESVKWAETALVVWTAGALSNAVEKSLRAWVEKGGVLLCFPTAREESAGPLGVSWTATETGEFRIGAWDELDGPLARTESGAALPLARLEVTRRRVPVLGEAAHAYASFTDGRAFLLGRKIGAGHIFACATLPAAEWSNLGEGVVLLPMVQRLLALGGQHLTPPTMSIAGEWQPVDPSELWTAVESGDWRWNAGVYRNGERLIALNRPAAEDAPETVERARLTELLPGVKLTVMADALALKADRLQSEIWPAMIVVAMLAMCAEMLLATSRALLPQRPAPIAAAPRAMAHAP